MQRLIDANALKDHKVYIEDRHEYCVPVFDIDNAPTVEPKRGEWIPVSERLPDKCNAVLFITEHGFYYVGHYYVAEKCHEFDGWYANGITTNTVTHWMPLPEPPCGADMRKEVKP